VNITHTVSGSYHSNLISCHCMARNNSYLLYLKTKALCGHYFVMDCNCESLLQLKITDAVNNNVKCKSKVCL
jgi:hypothetical protein